MIFRPRSTLLLLATFTPFACADDDPSTSDETGLASGTDTSTSGSSTASTVSVSTSATTLSGSTSGGNTSSTMTSSSDATGDTEDPTGTSGESTAEGVLGSSSGETEDTEGETSIPTLAKTLLRDLVPDLAAAGGLVPEKLESVAILASGDFYIANDNDGVSVGNGETQLLNLGNILDGNASPPERTARPATFQRIATFPICMQIDAACDTEEETVAEITAATDDGMMLVYTDGPSSRIGFVDITDPQAPQAAGLVELEGEPTSVAVHGDHVLVAVNLSDGNFEEPSGALVVIDLESRAIVETFPLEGQPDSIAVSPDGTYAAIIIENERDEDIHDGELPQLPGGWLSVVDVSADDVSAWTIDTVDLSLDDSFYGFEDPEPEFVDVNENNIAVVTLQENNGIALVDLETRAVISTFSAGEVDLEQVDIEEEDPAWISLTGSLTGVPREPDSVGWISADQFATADEGDLFGGSRTFTIFNTDGSVAFNVGNALEHTAVRVGHYPDGRSENKGVEPEGLEVGTFDDTPYLFVGSERASILYVYDVSGEPALHQVLPAPASPEGLLAIPSRNLLIASGEADDRGDKVRASISLYAYGTLPRDYPTLASADRDDGTPIPWGALSGMAAGEGAIIYAVMDSFYQRTRILTLDTREDPARIIEELELTDASGVFAAIPVETLADPTVDADHESRVGVFDEADLDALLNDDGSVNLDAEGIAVASDGGFWIVSEGAGTVGDPDRPVNSLNFLVKTDAAAAIEEVILLPEEINAMQLRFGFEGVAEQEGRVFVAFQRAWGADPSPRIGVYDPADASWSFFFYPLEAALSVNGGWVGVSEITPLGEGRFAVLERDDQAGPDAVLKRLYTIEVDDLRPVR